jgi:hypothetical protein
LLLLLAGRSWWDDVVEEEVVGETAGGGLLDEVWRECRRGSGPGGSEKKGESFWMKIFCWIKLFFQNFKVFAQ